MLFETEASQVTFQMLTGNKGTLEESILEFETRKSDFIKRLLNWKKSQQQKLNWKKYRFHYKFGIERYYRSPKGQDIRKRVMAQIRGGIVPKVREDSVEFSTTPYAKFEFLRDLSMMKALLFREAAVFHLEEEHVEYVLFVEEANQALSAVEIGILEDKPVTSAKVELFLCLIEEEMIESFSCDDGPESILDEESPLLSLLTSS